MKLPKLHMEVKTKTASDRSYDPTYKRAYSEIAYIVIHGTANDGDTDEANGNYFANTNRNYAGAHVFVDDDSCTKSVSLNRTAYSVGGGVYAGATEAGGASFYQRCTNANSLSIELCDTMKDGIFDISEATFQNGVEITAYYALKYGIKKARIIRHWDVNGKPCPSCMIGRDNALWNRFLAEVYELMDQCERL